MARTTKWMVAAAAGCALFGGGLAAGRWMGAAGLAGPADDSQVVATFSGGSVTAGELQAAAAEQGPMLRGSTGSAEARHKLVVQIARQKLLERAAVAKGYDRAPEVVRERRRALTALYLRKELDEPAAAKDVTEADLRAWLERHKAEFDRPERVRVADLFVAAPAEGAERRKKAAEAQALLQQLRKSSARDYYAFATAARQRSDDAATRSFGGDLPPATREELAARAGPQVAEAAFALRGAGTLADKPVETPQGFHLLQLRAREEASTADFAALRGLLRTRALAERRTADQEAFYAALERDGGLRVDDAALASLRIDDPTARAQR